jgi:hypothetical protein
MLRQRFKERGQECTGAFSGVRGCIDTFYYIDDFSLPRNMFVDLGYLLLGLRQALNFVFPVHIP